MLRPLLSANAGFIGETIMLRSSWHRVVIDSESTLAGVQVMAIARTSSASAARRTSRPTTTGGCEQGRDSALQTHGILCVLSPRVHESQFYLFSFLIVLGSRFHGSQFHLFSFQSFWVPDSTNLNSICCRFNRSGFQIPRISIPPVSF